MTAESPIRARFRVVAEDFEVEEVLGFEPDGQGEHLFLWIEKRGANTAWVAGELARWAGVAPMAVSYAGMKDRHAVTRQWFNVHLPKRVAPEDGPDIEGVQVLDRSWHGRKLKRGAHRGNRFAIVLRDIDGDVVAAELALARIAADGVPNAFGEQRFGRDAGNLDEAQRWLTPERPARLPHARRGLLLSSARSHLFNRVLDERVRRGDWNRPLAGDCFQLDGSGSWFGPEALITDELIGRAARGDIHPTGPLWGAGDPPTAAETHAIEMAVAAGEPVLAAGLSRFDLRQERRSLRLIPENFSWQWTDSAASTGTYDEAAAVGRPPLFPTAAGTSYIHVGRQALADALLSGTPIFTGSAGRLPNEAMHRYTDSDTGQAGPSKVAASTTLRLSFELRSGSFATAVLAAFCELENASRAT